MKTVNWENQPLDKTNKKFWLASWFEIFVVWKNNSAGFRVNGLSVVNWYREGSMSCSLELERNLTTCLKPKENRGKLCRNGLVAWHWQRISLFSFLQTTADTAIPIGVHLSNINKPVPFFIFVVPCIVILGWRNPTRCNSMQIFIYC